MLLPLAFASWLSLMLAGLAVSDCCFSLLPACVSALLGISSLQVIFVYGVLWHRINSEHERKPGNKYNLFSLQGSQLFRSEWTIACKLHALNYIIYYQIDNFSVTGANLLRHKTLGSFPSCNSVPVSWGFLVGFSEQKWWSYLCSQVCLQSFETSSLPAVFGYLVL